MSYTDISNVYLYGLREDKNYPVEPVDVVVTAATQIGDILQADGTLTADGEEATARYILIDERVTQGDGLTAGTHQLKVLTGNAGIGESYVRIGTGGTLSEALTQLRTHGFKFESQLSAS